MPDSHWTVAADEAGLRLDKFLAARRSTGLAQSSGGGDRARQGVRQRRRDRRPTGAARRLSARGSRPRVDGSARQLEAPARAASDRRSRHSLRGRRSHRGEQAAGACWLCRSSGRPTPNRSSIRSIGTSARTGHGGHSPSTASIEIRQASCSSPSTRRHRRC